MRIIATFDAADDCPHAVEADDSFQESALFVWYDLEAQVGGFWRIGQEPRVRAVNSCFGVFTDDGLRFRSNVSGAPMADSDRGATYMAWGDRLRVDLDRMAITATFPELTASLTFQDFFPRYDWHDLIRSNHPQDHARSHFEVAGRMVGQLRIQDRQFSINALGYRDRSWGPRKWGTLRGTRWWPAVFGPDLCVHTVAVVDERGHDFVHGYRIENGIATAMTQLDVVATLAYDALSPRSAEARFALDDGSIGHLVHEPADGIMMHVRGYTAIESIGRVRYNDRIGMSNFEINTNPAGGSKPPVVALEANTVDGLSQRSPRGVRR